MAFLPSINNKPDSRVPNNLPAALAARLVELGLDRTTRPYAAIQAIAESFKIMSNNIADIENIEELKSIKSALDRLEGANTYDIFGESKRSILPISFIIFMLIFKISYKF